MQSSIRKRDPPYHMTLFLPDRSGTQAWLDAFAESFADIHESCHQQQTSDSQQRQKKHQQQARNGNDGGPSSPASETSSTRRVSEDDYTLQVGGVSNDFGEYTLLHTWFVSEREHVTPCCDRHGSLTFTTHTPRFPRPVKVAPKVD